MTRSTLSKIAAGLLVILLVGLAAFRDSSSFARWNDRQADKACRIAIAHGYYTDSLYAQCLDDYRDSKEGR